MVYFIIFNKSSILKFRSELTACVHDFFYKKSFTQIHTPLLTTNNCEGGCETFQVKTKDSKEFFGASVFLTASAQLHLEAMTTNLSRVYTLSPTFRAEKSLTRHHLAEFYMLEAELVDMSRLETLLDFVETFVKTVSVRILRMFRKSKFSIKLGIFIYASF